ncbi:MAG: TPR repeat-containing protein [Candidatus Magnetoglobus multicellularis str. Araruama]|uniref:TPR repeat-containing protein n=1 Tax=Candidatus Magnetoglobus multicellularis str. Araruama TaxID=890399 RepID=A0A1V1PDF1_9BACT|nr:MAG: TPR repeat-containing protein [Candidatus Magnetoglobus multicellularis str. Araruama]
MTNNDSADQLNDDGIQWLGKGQLDRALACFEKAVQIDSQHAYAFCNIGRIYYEKNQLETARQYFERSLSIHPELAESYSNLGLTLHRLNHMDQAIELYQKALAIRPNYPIACHNMGFTLEKLGRLTESIQWYEKAIAMDPDYTYAHSNMGITLLLAGDYKRGFMEYEWRLKTKEYDQRTFQSIPWDGRNFFNKKLLIYPEQGYGDYIQFIRYLPRVKQLGGAVILETHKFLVPLFKELPYFDQIIIHEETSPPEVDYHVAIASLPHIFKTTLKTIPCDMPYLFQPKKETPVLVQTIEMINGFRVGISWAGSPIHKNDKNRSCPLSLFYPLTQMDGVVLFGIQKGPAVNDLKNATHMPVIDLSDLIQDFSDTATAIFHMDLIISVDTATAHLAGAMGKPVWMILPHAPDWRWMLDRHDSPWYPSIRLFRQPTPGDFKTVMQTIHQALIQVLQDPNAFDFIAKSNKTAINLYNQGRLSDATHIYKRLVTIAPNIDFFYANLGLVYLKAGQLDMALAILEKALSRPTANQSIMNRLIGIVYRRKGLYDLAKTHYQKGLDLNPNDPNIIDELGVLAEKQGQLDNAITNYKKAISLRPESPETYRNLAHALLLKGELKEGFKTYEWRIKCSDYKCRIFNEIPMWQGERFSDKTLFLCTEQGFGDIIQFIRYAPMVKSLGGSVAFGTFPNMIRLISSVKGIDRVFSREPISNFAYQIPLLSLPAIFETDLDTIPTNIPYIFPPEKVGDWIAIVRDNPAKFKIGISWAGSPKHPEDQWRSMTLDTLEPLLSLSHTKEIAFFSLQIGERALTESDKHLPIIDLNPHIDDFADSAAAIDQLDLVISVDTATAHLAGAMGKPVWLMLPTSPDWRWMLHRKDSPWYPTMCVFRQTHLGDWSSVVNNIVRSLCVEAGINGDLFFNRNQLTEAESWYQLSMKIDPFYMPAYSNMGVICEKRNQTDRAIDWYRQALFLEPDSAPTHKNLGHALLLKGKLAEGFKEYQWRLKCKKFLDDPKHDIEFWQGQPLENKTILLYSEQGFGDIIQFIRYAPFLKERGATTVVATFPNLTRLLAKADGIDRAVSHAQESEFDYQVHLLTLPHLLGTHEHNIPAKLPYLHIDQKDVDHFKTIMDITDTKIHVGLVWSGDPKHPNDKNRSIPLKTLSPLLNINAIQFYCFQKEYQKDISPYENIIDLSEHLNDFYDTAAAMMHLDAVVSVDTAPAHLAGALGKQVYLLLPFVPDWRWMLNCTNTPWYPAMKLLRQSRSQQWPPVITQLLTEIATIFCDKGDKLLQSQQYSAAIDMYQHALNQNPSHGHAHNNLGVALQFTNQMDPAKSSFLKAVQNNPYNAEAWNNLGSILSLMAHTDDAISALQHAISLSDDYGDAHFNLAINLLKKATESVQARSDNQPVYYLNPDRPKLNAYPIDHHDFQNGFKAYEWRWQSSQFPCKIHSMPGKPWFGESLDQKSLLVVSEQGAGDIFFFCRFLKMIPQCNLFVETTRETVSILKHLLPGDQIITDGDPLPDVDYHAFMGSLPHLLKLSISQIVTSQPYINGPSTINDAIQTIIKPYDNMMKVGLVWASGGVHQHLDKRTYGLNYFSQLFDLQNVHFFSLQKGPRGDDITHYPNAPITDMQQFIDNFEDTAAIISQMDLIITTDTSVAHLAGAMGSQTWIALPFAPDWRWGETGSKSCWYANVHFFRQQKQDDYPLVMKKIRTVLHELIQRRTTQEQTLPDVPQKNDKKYLVHGIGYIYGHTGYNIHSSNFFAQLKRYVPYVQTDLQMPELTREKTDAALNSCENPIVNIAITYGNKMNLLQACPGIKIGYTVWESTRLPDDWLEPMKYPHQLWTPSTFCKTVMVNHGFDPNHIKVVPEGIDPTVFHPKVKPLPGSDNIQGFKFLNVGKYEERKCTPYMIRAFDEEFKDTKDVKLILSCHNPFEKGFNIRKNWMTFN